MALCDARCNAVRRETGVRLTIRGRLRAIAKGVTRRLGPPFARLREWFPLTARGLLVLASTAGALWLYGFRALDGVWYVAGVGLIGLCVVSVVSVLLAAVRMRFWLSRHAHEAASERMYAETRRPVQTHYRVPRLRFWVFVEVELEWLSPERAQVQGQSAGAWLEETVQLQDHAELVSVLRRVVIRDVFGLSSFALRQQSKLDLAVLPHAGALRSLPLLRSLTGGDDVPHPMGVAQGDRLELRRYAPGDPARFIHWKVFARTQKLVVRMPERALSRAHRVAAYLVSGEHDGASAAAARVALEEAAFGADFCFGADGSSKPLRALEPGLSAIRRSSAERARSGQDLTAFVREVEREGPASFVVFVPPRVGPAVEAVKQALGAKGSPVRVVIGVDGILRDGQRSLWERLAMRPQGTDSTPLHALREVIAAYQKINCEVLVLDRESGRALGEAHLKHAAQVAGEAA